MARRSQHTRQQAVRAWLHLLFRDLLSPALGIGILVWQTVVADADRPWLIVASLTLLGYPFADRVDKWLKGVRPDSLFGGNGGNGGHEDDDDPDVYGGPGGYYRSGEDKPRRRRK